MLHRYRGYAWLGGAALGLVAGVLISGPHFFDWPAMNSLGVVLGGGAVGALAGWLFGAAVVGSLAASAGPSGALSEVGHASGGDGDFGGGNAGGED